MAGRELEKINKWCLRNGLYIFGKKTMAMMLKEKFDIERRLKIILNANRIKFYSEVKYLGVYLDKRLSFLPHVKYPKEKIKKVFGKIKRVNKSK